MPDSYLAQSIKVRNAFFDNNKELLEELAGFGQSPDALFIGCSDSRVVPEQLLGAKPGDLFMLRNIGNVVPPYWNTDIGVASVLEFAVFELQVAHIIVCGHTDCGAIWGVDKPIDMSEKPALARWLDLIKPAQIDVDHRKTDFELDQRHQSIVEKNVINQLDNLTSYPFIRQNLEKRNLKLHGWVYYLKKSQIGYFDPEAGKFD
jgi:carbonic anhydrase